MRLIPILFAVIVLVAGCAFTVRGPVPPGKAKHVDGPGHSESAPGQKQK